MRLVYIIVAIFSVKLIDTLKVPIQTKNTNNKKMNGSDIRELFKYNLAPEHILYRKSIDPSKTDKSRQLYKMLINEVGTHQKSALRKSEHQTTRDPNYNLRNEHAYIAEKELTDALARKKSALYDHPYVESKGGNDFLVLRPGMLDPYVTVIPNDIYYATEKKCVNWLDDCSLQGIRSRLLRGIQWPYK